MPVALVTGGASGIGLAVVEYLVDNGFHVCIMDLNEDLREQMTAKFGDKILFHCGNVIKYEDQGQAFRRTWDKWGELDLVFANAGIGDRIDFFKPEQELGRAGVPPKPDALVLDVCLYGVVWTAYLSLHFFRKNKSNSGLLLMTSSLAGLYPAAPVPLYGAAKHAVIGLARSMAKRVQERGEPIRVNVVCPGFVATPLVSAHLAQVVPEDMKTPSSTVVAAVARFVQSRDANGEVAECSGKEVLIRPVLPYGNRQAEYWVESQYKDLIDLAEITRDSEEKGRLLTKMEAN